MSFKYILRTVLFAALTLTFSGVKAEDQDQPREGGLTGTGIVGIVQDLGSININGHWIRFDDDMMVTGPLGAISAADLRKGHSVAAMVTPAGSDWSATELVQTYPIIGPVQTLSQNEMTIMGTTVDLSSLALSPDVVVGDWVAVSGLWRGEVVLASQVEPIAPQEYAQLFGSYVAQIEGRPLQLGATVIEDIVLEHAQPGDVIRIFGVPTNTSLRAREVDLGLFDQPIGIMLAQGFITVTGPGRRYSIPGSGIKVFVSDESNIMSENDQMICGLTSENSEITGDALQRQAQILALLDCR